MECRTRRDFLKIAGWGPASLAVSRTVRAAERTPGRTSNKPSGRPNVLWIISDDHSRADLGCYGHPLVKTPNIDRLAREGVRFTNAYAAAPTCAPTRSGLITGMAPISLGAHNQRNDRAVLPEHVRLLPHYMKEAGYFCVNANWNLTRPGKTDYQFQYDRKGLYERATDWARRKPGQPFFAQVQISEPHRAFKTDPENPIDPDQIALPPYYPDDPVVRIDFAQYLESIQIVDRKVGRILKKLEAEGDAENTIVFFFSDQGRPFPRGKQFLYDEGLGIPLIVRWPETLRPGTVDDRLVSMLDFAPTCLALAGVHVPDHIHGRVFLGTNRAAPRLFIFASRDRVDDAVDRIRCLRTKRFKYIRNFHPDKPYDMNETYMVMMHPTLAALRQYHAGGKLNEAQSLWMAAHRPGEEVYDVENDPHELRNLADDKQYRTRLLDFRQRLDEWVEKTGDRGRVPESDERLEQIRKQYRDRLANTLKKRGLTSVDHLYDYWRRTLKPTQR